MKLMAPPRMNRILVVDDEPTLRLGFTFALKTEDYEVNAASNGSDALELLDEEDYDLVILDLRMPVMDGLETLAAIRQSKKRAHLPVILCSAHINTATAVQALNLSCFHFLSKPVRPSELRDEVASVIDPSHQSLIERIAQDLRDGHHQKALDQVPELESLPRRNIPLWKTIFQTLASGSQLKREALINEWPDLVDFLLVK